MQGGLSCFIERKLSSLSFSPQLLHNLKNELMLASSQFGSQLRINQRIDYTVHGSTSSVRESVEQGETGGQNRQDRRLEHAVMECLHRIRGLASERLPYLPLPT